MPSTIHWKNEKRKVSDLLPADYNPRRISDKEKADLEHSLRTWGYVVPVAINTGSRENILIGGHQRVGILAALGRLEEEVDVRVPDRELNLDEEKELNISLNRMGGQFDWEKLYKGFDIEMLLRSGFESDELQKMWDDVDLIDDLERPRGEGEAKEELVPRMAVGDVFQLGNHRVMLGDATLAADVKKLMGAEKADMVYCDPPQEYTKADEGEYRDMLFMSMDNAKDFAKDDAHVFYWCDEMSIMLTQSTMETAKITPRRICLWIRSDLQSSPKVAFGKAYEPCVYGTIGNPYLDKRYAKLNEILNAGMETGNQTADEIRDLFNIWIVSKKGATYEEPGAKPLTLHQKPLRRCTAPGHVVLDLFGGSGSTMMACEQMGRYCRTMENDPEKCEAMIRRWELFTGNKAIQLP